MNFNDDNSNMDLDFELDSDAELDDFHSNFELDSDDDSSDNFVVEDVDAPATGGPHRSDQPDESGRYSRTLSIMDDSDEFGESFSEPKEELGGFGDGPHVHETQSGDDSWAPGSNLSDAQPFSSLTIDAAFDESVDSMDDVGFEDQCEFQLDSLDLDDEPEKRSPMPQSAMESLQPESTRTVKPKVGRPESVARDSSSMSSVAEDVPTKHGSIFSRIIKALTKRKPDDLNGQFYDESDSIANPESDLVERPEAEFSLGAPTLISAGDALELGDSSQNVFESKRVSSEDLPELQTECDDDMPTRAVDYVSDSPVGDEPVPLAANQEAEFAFDDDDRIAESGPASLDVDHGRYLNLQNRIDELLSENAALKTGLKSLPTESELLAPAAANTIDQAFESSTDASDEVQEQERQLFVRFEQRLKFEYRKRKEAEKFLVQAEEQRDEIAVSLRETRKKLEQADLHQDKANEETARIEKQLAAAVEKIGAIEARESELQQRESELQSREQRLIQNLKAAERNYEEALARCNAAESLRAAEQKKMSELALQLQQQIQEQGKRILDLESERDESWARSMSVSTPPTHESKIFPPSTQSSCASVSNGSPPNDDLTQIAGIGPVTQKKLYLFGITSFEQIAHWTENDAITLDRQLSLKGRVTRDGWVKQAEALLDLKNKKN